MGGHSMYGKWEVVQRLVYYVPQILQKMKFIYGRTIAHSMGPKTRERVCMTTTTY